jgi:hypothetical protein
MFFRSLGLIIRAFLLGFLAFRRPKGGTARAPSRHRQPGYKIRPPQLGPQNPFGSFGFPCILASQGGAARATKRHRQPGYGICPPRSLGLRILAFLVVSLSFWCPRKARPERQVDTASLDTKLFPRSLGVRIIVFHFVSFAFGLPNGGWPERQGHGQHGL